MLLKDGTIKVTDFGIARFSHNETQTMTDRAIGSVHYISPEQARGSIIDEKADLYSVGVMLYEMITGKLPFEADNAVSVAIMQMQSNPKPPREINPNIPKGLEQIILHSMEKESSHRYSSAEEMIFDIEKIEDNPEITFNYDYFVDDTPTRFIDNIDGVNKNKNNYGDRYNYKEEKKQKSKATFIASGIAAAVALLGLIIVFITYFGSCGNSSAKDVDVPNFIGMQLSDVQNNPDYKFVWKVESVYDSTKPEGIIVDQDPLPGSKKIKEDSTIVLKVNSSGVLVTVPNVTGLTEEVAKSKLTNAGLKYDLLMIEDNDVQEGLVVNVSPQEGSKVTSDTTVKLYVSKGPSEEKVTVPDVINKTLSSARNELSSAGLKVSDNISYENSDKPKDTVISMDPLPGVSVDKDSTVKLTVSSGVKREKTLSVSVDLPSEVTHEITVTTYVDGVLEENKKVVPSYNGTYVFQMKGTGGKKTVNVNLDGSQYRVYEVNFDASSNNVKRIRSYSYKEKTSNTQQNVDENSVYGN